MFVFLFVCYFAYNVNLMDRLSFILKFLYISVISLPVHQKALAISALNHLRGTYTDERQHFSSAAASEELLPRKETASA